MFITYPKLKGVLMTKKSFFVLFAALFLLFNSAIAHAQKVYLLTGGDIHDSKIGVAVVEDIRKFASLFFLFEPDKQVVYYNQTQLWTGPDIFFSSNYKEAILTAIRKCPATSSDKIVFYWSGHGAYDQKGHYLFMPRPNKGVPRQVMYRSEIMNALKEKGASLTVLITDSCHIFHETLKSAPAFDGTEKFEGIPPLFRSLFFDCKGVVNINSSGLGEKSYCTPNGSIFTNNFVTYAYDNLNKYWDWKGFLNEVQKTVREDRYYFFYDDKVRIINQNICVWGYLPALSKFSSSPWKILKSKEPFYEQFQFEPIFEPLYLPQKGDRIISVNDTKIRNSAHFNQVIRDIDTYATFTLIDHQTGKTMNLAMNLNPPGSNTRLGINIQDDPNGGVKVTGVKSGMPGEKCYIIMDKSILEDEFEDPKSVLDAEFEDLECEDSAQSSYIRPVYGDRIISVNNITILNEAHFRQIIRDSGDRITFTLIDRQTGKTMNLTANLNPPGLTTRLGIYVQNDSRGGVMVTGVKSGTPGEKCRMQTNSSNASNDINNNEQWSAPIYYLVKGDRIIYVNNIRIQNETHYRQVIRDADTQVTLTVIDYKTGRTCKLKTDLLPPGSTIRLGIYVQNDSRGGVMVTGVKSGTPGTKCRMLK